MHVDNDIFHGGIGNQPSAFSSLYLSNFLPFHTLNNEIFLKDFCETMQARIVIFGMQADNVVLYCGTANQPHAYSSPNLLDFLSFHIWHMNFYAPVTIVRGALRFAPVCPSVCPSLRHALWYRVCVINFSHSF